MRGHVASKKSKTGIKYYIVVDVRDELTGKRKRKWLTGKDGKGFERKRDAEREMPEVLKRFYEGSIRSTSAGTFGELMEMWMKDKKNSVRAGTWKSYEWLVKDHLIPHLGTIKADKLIPKHFRTLYHDILLPKISASSIKKLHVLVNHALNRAVTDGELIRNVASSVELPKSKRNKSFQVWNEQQVETFMKIAKNDLFFMVFELALSTGMRQSEILGLPRTEVDLNNKTISVRQAWLKAETGYEFDDPKSEHSERSIALFPETVEHLREHLNKQKQHHMLNRKVYSDHGLVIQTGKGTPVNQSNVSRHFFQLIEKAGLPRIRFHDLRHTHATILLKNGVHPKIVQERLGHSSINVTLDIYSHVLPNLQAAVLASIGTSITGGSKNTLGR